MNTFSFFKLKSLSLILYTTILTYYKVIFIILSIILSTSYYFNILEVSLPMEDWYLFSKHCS